MKTSSLGVIGLALSLLVGPGTLVAQAPDPAQNIRDAEAAKRGNVYVANAPRLENEARLHQLVRSMNREMALLNDTADGPERARLMDMHSRHLHETMMLLRVTAGTDMSQVVAEHTDIASERPPQAAEGEPGAEERVAMLEKRVDMMQMVMEAMLDHLTMVGTRH